MTTAIKQGIKSFVRFFELSGDGREQREELRTIFESCVGTALVSKKELLKALSNTKYASKPEYQNSEFVTGVAPSTAPAAASADAAGAGAGDAPAPAVESDAAAAAPVDVPDVLLTFEQVFNALRDMLGWDQAKQERVQKSNKIEKLCFSCPSTSVATVDVIAAILEDGMFGPALKLDFVPDRYKTLSEMDKKAGIKLPFTSHPIFFTADPARLTHNQLETLFHQYFDFGKTVLETDRAFYELQKRAYNKSETMRKASKKANELKSVLGMRVRLAKFLPTLRGIISSKDAFWSSPIAAAWVAKEAVPVAAAAAAPGADEAAPDAAAVATPTPAEEPADISWEEVYRGLLQSMCPGVASCVADNSAVAITAGASSSSSSSSSDALSTLTALGESVLSGVLADAQASPTSVATVPAVPSMPTSSFVLQLQQDLAQMTAKYQQAMSDGDRLSATINQQSQQLQHLQHQIASALSNITPANVSALASDIKQNAVRSAIGFVEEVLVDAAGVLLGRSLEPAPVPAATAGDARVLRSARVAAAVNSKPAPEPMVFGRKKYHPVA